MPKPLRLLKWIGKAVLAASGGGAFVSLLESGAEIAAEVWEEWQTLNQTEKVEELEQIAQASSGQIVDEARAAADELAADQPEQVRQQLATYLMSVPAQVRRTLRRPSDPGGTTIPPGTNFNAPTDVQALLPPRLPRFQPGDKPLEGSDLELIEMLGVGGFGEVWKARRVDQPDGELVALKFCLDPNAARSLRNEAAVLDRIMRQGRHPGIVQLLESHLSADPPFLEYELVEGGDLAGLLEEYKRHVGAMPPARAKAIVARIARAISSAHAQSPPIVHRDLKPANILVRHRGKGKVLLKVADFGIGGVASDEVARQTRQGTLSSGMLSAIQGAYTPLYAAPEQVRGLPADPRDDVYSLGVIWFQLVTGNLMAGAPTGTRWVKQLEELGLNPAEIDLIADCLDSEAEYRPENATVLVERLEESSRYVAADATPVAEPAAPQIDESAELAGAPPARRARAHGVAPTDAGTQLPPPSAPTDSNIVRQISLYFQRGTSDKVYEVDIYQSGDGYVVNYRYGRRGAELRSGTKTPLAVSREEAEQIYDRLVSSKVNKGYLVAQGA